MVKYIAKIKEVGHQNILTSSLTTDVIKTKEELIAFWGLDQNDIESYTLYEVMDGKEVKL